MIEKKILKIGMFLLLGVLLTFSVSAAYQRSYGQYTQFQQGSGLFDTSSLQFDNSLCGQVGQDFIVQIAPFGCEPAVVRQDLLEEQNVPVFCQLAATKINPLIDVEAIESLTFQGGYPPEVAGIGFQPARAALGGVANTNNPVLNNIGYAVIVLKQVEDARNLPEIVTGNITAKIKYDIKNAFGIGRAQFHLPVLTEDEWEERKTQYSFWNAKGYVRADEVVNGQAVISLYDDTHKLQSVRLAEGETSEKISLPGFSCFANLQLRVDDISSPETRARLTVNGEVVEVAEGESFLDGKCTVNSIDKKGLSENVIVSCREDDAQSLFRTKPLELVVSPTVNLKITNPNTNEITEGEYNVGDQLYQYDNNRFVYLGYVGQSPDGLNYYVVPVVSPAKDSEGFKKTVVYNALPATIATLQWKSGNVLADSLKSLTLGVSEGVATLTTRIFSGSSPIGLVYSNGDFIGWPGSVEGVSYSDEVIFQGFATPSNTQLSDELRKQYLNADDDYETLKNDFPSEKTESTGTFNSGEQAAIKQIELANRLQQKRTVKELCDRLKEDFPATVSAVKGICNDVSRLSSSESSDNLVFVNGRSREINLDRIVEPTFEDYGAEVTISGDDLASSLNLKMVRGIRYPLAGNNEFVELISVEDGSVSVRFTVEQNVKDSLLTVPTNTRVNLGSFEAGIGLNNYRIDLTNIHLKKEATVSVIPSIDEAGSTVDFNYQIGIEKRAIQLSPEQTNKRIDSLDKTIKDWQEKSDNLGNVVKGFKTACLSVGAVLTVKNFFANTGGAGIARQKVMSSPGGWKERCSDLVNKGTYSTQQQCYNENADIIEADVQKSAEVIDSQNKIIKEQDQKGALTEGGFFQENVVNTDTYVKQAAPRVQGLVGTEAVLKDPTGVGDDINTAEIKELLTYDSWKNKRVYNQAHLRDIEYNEKVLADSSASESLKASARADLYKIYSDINANSANVLQSNSVIEHGWEEVNFGATTKLEKVTYSQEVQFGSLSGYSGGGIANDAKVQNWIDKSNGNEYILVLDDTGVISKTYRNQDGALTLVTEDNSKTLTGSEKFVSEQNPLGLEFNKLDKQALQNVFKNAEIKYYETAPYEGLPAIVPFSHDDGWYAATKQTIPIGGAIQAFDKSGRISSFYLCNVGSNGLAEFFSGIGDDYCELINLGTGQPYNQFPGLTSQESSKLVACGVDAIEQASRKHSTGVSGKIQISTSCGSETSNVGTPAANLPDVECQDFMSPQDCKLLFNVCDPVTCPSSRCNLGGAFPVKDPIQTGIIGGLTLCLPNYKEGVYVPICLSGVKAGIDGLLSVYKSYQSCLQDSLETGKYTGICDEIYSINMCETFWRQGSQFASIAIPKVVAGLTGQGGSRGGGEYLNVQNAWDTASQSADYFVNYYGADSFAAFKARSTEEIGSLICKTSISGVYPKQGNVFDQLTEPDSPPQYHARFDEIPFTTTTNPPISQYKVWYHIYAGEIAGAYYKVYLKPSAQGSFFQDVGTSRLVDQGFIPAGETVDNTNDFTAPTGFKELCINVNGQEECGFKEVTTSFAFDYVNDLHDQDIATQEDIKTEAECVSGSVSGYSLVSPSIAGAGEELINPAIYNRGIIRTCATGNPGQNTDPERWREVGICGNENLKCWLDTDSVKNVIIATDIEGQTLSQLNNSANKLFQDEGRYVQNFGAEIKKINDENDSVKKVSLINSLLSMVYLNNQKAELFLRRGNAYTVIVKTAFEKYILEENAKKEAAIQSSIDAKKEEDLAVTENSNSVGGGTSSGDVVPGAPSLNYDESKNYATYTLINSNNFNEYLFIPIHSSFPSNQVWQRSKSPLYTGKQLNEHSDGELKLLFEQYKIYNLNGNYDTSFVYDESKNYATYLWVNSENSYEYLFIPVIDSSPNQVWNRLPQVYSGTQLNDPESDSTLKVYFNYYPVYTLKGEYLNPNVKSLVS